MRYDLTPKQESLKQLHITISRAQLKSRQVWLQYREHGSCVPLQDKYSRGVLEPPAGASTSSPVSHKFAVVVVASIPPAHASRIPQFLLEQYAFQLFVAAWLSINTLAAINKLLYARPG